MFQGFPIVATVLSPGVKENNTQGFRHSLITLSIVRMISFHTAQSIHLCSSKLFLIMIRFLTQSSIRLSSHPLRFWFCRPLEGKHLRQQILKGWLQLFLFFSVWAGKSQWTSNLVWRQWQCRCVLIRGSAAGKVTAFDEISWRAKETDHFLSRNWNKHPWLSISCMCSSWLSTEIEISRTASQLWQKFLIFFGHLAF